MEKEYHILSLSGGKDSTALAFFMKENMPEIFEKLELVFCDTEQEIPETYDYLRKIEVFLNKKITHLRPRVGFEQIFQTRKILPAVNRRWCTVELKTKPFNQFVHNLLSNQAGAKVILYIGIRADESFRTNNRDKFSDKLIEEHFPFVEHNITRTDVDKILENCGIGYSDYYKWRKRSGCYFCMFQSKKDWLNLHYNHPELYKKAMSYEYEQTDYGDKKRFGWNPEISLKELIKPENIEIVEMEYSKLQKRKSNKFSHCKTKLVDIF